MRALLISFIVLAACTKPNPNRCCTDEADCTAKDIPVGSLCEQGLVCRGNQCIAQPCASSEQCDAAAPYCIAELCAEECAEDAQCPGKGESADEVFCIAGDCVTCRDATDCGTNVPVCESGSCRACTSHDECGSEVCDAGQCIAETSIAYAAPSGSATSSCSLQQPCTFERALTVSDTTRNVIKLLPGTYPASSAPTGYWYFRGRYQLSVYGPATLQSAFLLEVPTTGSGTPDLRVRDLSTTSWISCDGAGAVVVVPLLELDHVAIDLSNNPDTGSNVALNVEACKLTMRDSQVRVTDPFGNALRLAGGGGAGGQLAVVERSLLQVREGATTSGVFPISISDFASLQMSNSVVRGGSTLGGAIALGTNVSPSTVRFTTFFNTTLKCPTGVPVLASQNNIFLNELNGAAADTVTGSSCTHRFVMAKPQGTSLGADNMLNMDPRFVDGAGGDFHLIAGSPAIDAADPAATEAVDFDGTARPQGAGRDIGAFEFK